MSDVFDLPLLASGRNGGRVELFRSYNRFATYFENATRMRVVTYCDSPAFILELFDKVDTLKEIEVVVGDIADYRERLLDKPELADQLEQLKQEDRLVIYLCENKEVHSKVYLIEYGSIESGAEGVSNESGASSGSSQQTLGVSEEDSLDGTTNDTEQRSNSSEAKATTNTEEIRNSTVIIGSANLSKNAWTRQANAGVVLETTTNTELWDKAVGFYEKHREYNDGGPFLDDLTERLSNSNDDREEVLTFYTEGKIKTRDEVEQLHGRLDDRVEDEADKVNLILGEDIDLSENVESVVANHETSSDDGDQNDEADQSDEAPENLDPTEQSSSRINLSLVGHSDGAIETLAKMTDFDASISGDSLVATPQAIQQYKQDVFEVPTMRVARDDVERDGPRGFDFGDHLTFHIDGQVYRVGQPLPAENGRVDAALQGIENYFNTVDKYGNCNDPDAVKAHMTEALLWMFWAPFTNRAAAFYDQYRIDLDKALPNLYIYGESDAGKGTFAQFVLSLMSGGRVQQPVDADEIGKRKVRGMRSANTAFPIVVDDITKDTVNRLDTFRNYWGNWTPEASYPLFAFISNDKRPDEWFRNRSKILHFDVNFDTSYKGEAEVNRLIEQDNPIFMWFVYEFLDREPRLTDDDDALRTAREVLLDMYEYADRRVPDWFPRRPAEEQHDAGRDRWFDLLQREDVITENRGDTLRVSFPEAMSTDTYTYARDPPTVARVERRGRDILIKAPTEFVEWLGEPPASVALNGHSLQSSDSDEQEPEDNTGMLNRVRRLFG